jgi:hypothetical protein
MLIDAVRRFVTLSKQHGVKGSDPSVKELMTTLRRSGYSSSQISELSGWKWSSTLVRQYTKNWGGVNEELDIQRNSLMTSLRELVSSNYDITDIENCLTLERSVKAKGSNLEEFAELNIALRNLDLHPREISRLITLSRGLLEQNLPVNIVQYWVTLDHELIEQGFNKEARNILFQLCNNFGGVTETLNAVRLYNDLNEIQSNRLRLSNEVEWFSGEKELLEFEIAGNKELVNATNNAIRMGFDVASLIMISVLAQNLGGPYKVAEAITKYQSITEIDEETASKRAILDKVKRDTIMHNGHLTALNYTLIETKGVYERNAEVRQVVNLLVDPRGLRMDKFEVVGLLTQVLDSSITTLEEPYSILNSPDPLWTNIVQSIKTLSLRLRQFSKGKNGT